MLISGGSGAIVKNAYVDVFDTVGARGMPPSLLGPLATAWNSQYKFHDMALSSVVKRARHALAIDEQPVFYVPAKWENLDKHGLKNGLKNGAVSSQPAIPVNVVHWGPWHHWWQSQGAAAVVHSA
jgi:hypothetical protein